MLDKIAESRALAENRGGRPENGFLLHAEPIMNAQAVLADAGKQFAREANVLRGLAAERERMAQRISAVLVSLCVEIASRERVGIR